MNSVKWTILCAALTFTVTGIVRAQSVQTVSDIWYDSTRNVVAATGQTFADYGTGYYYAIDLSTGLYIGDQFIGGTSATGSTYAGTYYETSAEPGVEYTNNTGSNVTVSYLAYQFESCTWECYYPYDAYGYDLISNTPSSPTYDVWVWAPPIVAGVVYAAQIYLGPTSKKVTTPGAPNPLFTIIARSFIPFPYVFGGPLDTCNDIFGNPHSLIFKGDNRSYANYTADYRTVSVASALVGSGTLQSYAVDTGQSYSFVFPVPQDPNGAISASAYDGVLFDCYLEFATGRASTSDMHVTPFRTGVNQMQVGISGSAGNPLTISPTIDWNYTVGLNSVQLNAPRYTISFTTDCFPAHEVWIGTQQIHGYTPTSSDIVTIGYCLSGFGQITGSHSDAIY